MHVPTGRAPTATHQSTRGLCRQLKLKGAQWANRLMSPTQLAKKPAQDGNGPEAFPTPFR
jgi:hypothetical protein